MHAHDEASLSRTIFHELAGNVSPRQQTDFAYAKACNWREQFTN